MNITCPNCQSENRSNAVHCQMCGKVLRDPQNGGLLPGTLLQNRYSISRVVGEGGMGMVYEARDQSLGDKRCAIKALLTTSIPPVELPDVIDSFRREAMMMARLDHPSLPGVTDRFEERGEYYIVMDFVQGERLQDAFEARGRKPYPVDQVLAWAASLCDVLDYLHTQNPPIIFRDLKPGNLIITARNTLKLIDFGIARFYDPAKSKDTHAFGTPGYCAPEQHGKGTTARSDIYALGVIMHELLTGYDPCSTPFHLPMPRELNPALSPAVEMVIARAVQLEPRNRFNSAKEMKSAILSAQTISVQVPRVPVGVGGSPYAGTGARGQQVYPPPPGASVYRPPVYPPTAPPKKKRSVGWTIFWIFLILSALTFCCWLIYVILLSSSGYYGGGAPLPSWQAAYLLPLYMPPVFF